ncbi:MAG: hypothetical protein NXI25_23180 [bacterium]|nr:hypothetical protein [bacterium]
MIQIRIPRTLLLLALSLLYSNCHEGEQQDCVITEKHANEGIKVLVCPLDVQKELYEVQTYYPTGELKVAFSTRDSEIIGKALEYFKTGEIKKSTEYLNGLKHGDSFTYDEEGELVNYNYFYEGNVLYAKSKKDINGRSKLLETYIPLLEKSEVTNFSIGDTLSLKVGLPIPDSLLKGRDIYFGFGVKPLKLADSVIIDAKKEVYIEGDTSIQCSIKLGQSGVQLLYGYIIDRSDMHVFEPFEDTILVSLPR